jgi:hypothetical protein
MLTGWKTSCTIIFIVAYMRFLGNMFTKPLYSNDNGIHIHNLIKYAVEMGRKRYRSWLRHYATSRKVAGSTPDKVIGFLFNVTNHSRRTMALGFTQPLTELSTRSRRKCFCGVNRIRRVWLTTSPPSVSYSNLRSCA